VLIIASVLSKLTLSDKIIAVGFCWGARYAFLMAQEPSKVDVVIANHPSFVTDADLENVKTPSALLKGDHDVGLALCDRIPFAKHSGHVHRRCS
jgi:dienelactone hydrolase